jgi:phospholipid/cholesterol/gamma-HCH transport system ATP-binding protein
MSIELTDVSKRFPQAGGDPLVVLDGCGLVIPTGRCTVVIGKSGSGKSVILKHITGLMRPDKGSVRVAGIEVTTATNQALFTLRARIGFLFQGSALFDSMSVHDNVAFALRERKMVSEREIEEIVVGRLMDVGLKPEVAEKMPADLSGGMKKRVALARVLAFKPDYILYDEPTTGLDPITADAINDLIVETGKKFGVTSVVVTHDMASARKVGDTIAMLYKGRIIETLPTAEFMASRNPFVRQFVDGSSRGPISMLE